MLKTIAWKRKALVALQRYYLGDTIHTLNGRLVSTPTNTSVQIGPRAHVEDEYGAFMNHSCLPNTIIHNEQVIATCTINIGTELTYNYIKTETALAKPFLCDFCHAYIDGKNTVCPTYKREED